MLKLDKLVFRKLNRIEIDEFFFSFLFKKRKNPTILYYQSIPFQSPLC